MRNKRKRTFWLFLCSYISVLLIPVLILTAFWGPRMQQNAQREAEIRNQNNLTLVAEQLDQQLNIVYSIPKQIFEHPRIVLSSVMDNPISLRNACSDLATLISGNTFIEFAMLYLREAEYFLSARTSSFYFSNLAKYPGTYQLTFGNMPLHDMYELLETVDSNQVGFYASALINNSTYKDMLLFFLPFPNEKQAIATCVIGVLDSRIDRLIKPITADGSACMLFDEHGKLVYCSHDAFRECLSTLEHPVSNEIKTETLTLAGEEYSVASIGFSRTGWSYVSVTPMSTILQDTYRVQRSMLIILLGVFVISSITIFFSMRMNYAPLRRLTSLAHSHALETDQKSNDFEQIQHLIVQLYSENKKLDRQLSASDEQLRDMLLTRVLYGNMQEVKHALSSAQALHLEMGESCWHVLLAEYEEKEMLENAAASAAAEPDLFVLHLAAPKQLACIRYGVETEELPERILLALGAPQRLVVSELTDKLEGLNAVYSSACAAMDYLYSSDIDQSILYCSSLQERFYNPRFYPLDVMQALENAITHGSSKQVDELMRQIEALLAVDGAPPYYIRSIYYNTISLLINGLRNASKENDELITELTTRSVLPRYTIREMISILRSTAEKLSAVLESKEDTSSRWADELAYIDQRISTPEFSLQEMADHMSMSASAFSRMFKETMGKNFKEYVDDVRILRAREMLSRTDMPIEQVANQVGYENVSSFYRFFKRYTGVAPGTYRSVSRNDGKSIIE